MFDKAPVKPACPVVVILDRFLEHCERNAKPATYGFYHDPVKSFAKYIGPKLQIATLMGHVDLKMVSRIYQHIRKRSDHLREGLRRATGEIA